MHVGDRVMPRDGQATGTIEEIRPSSPSSDGDYLVAEVLWDTGARCAEPLSWLGLLEDVQAANRKREREREAAIRKEQRKHLADYQPRRCEGCAGVFTPARKGQRFCTSKCRLQARRSVTSRKKVPGTEGRHFASKSVPENTPLSVTRLVYRECSRCSREFTPIRSTARFCGAACRQAANRAKVKQS